MQTSACMMSCCSRAVKNWRTESLEAEASEPLVADMMVLFFLISCVSREAEVGCSRNKRSVEMVARTCDERLAVLVFLRPSRPK